MFVLNTSDWRILNLVQPIHEISVESVAATHLLNQTCQHLSAIRVKISLYSLRQWRRLRRRVWVSLHGTLTTNICYWVLTSISNVSNSCWSGDIIAETCCTPTDFGQAERSENRACDRQETTTLQISDTYKRSSDTHWYAKIE